MADGDDKSNDGSADKGSNSVIKIMVGEEEKSFSAEDVKNLVAQQAAATQMSQDMAPFKKVLDKYGTDAVTYLGQSEGALTAVKRAIDAGVIDSTTGEIIQKEIEQKGGLGDDDLNLGGEKGVGNKTLEIINKALGERLDPLEKQIKSLEQENLSLLREDTSRKIKEKFPGFTDKDVTRLFRRAGGDQRKSLTEHAEMLREEMTGEHEAGEAAMAKKYGLDLETLRNNLKEQDDGGGGAAALFKGKRLSFKRGPGSMGDKDAVRPREAMQEFMKKALYTEE